MYSPKTLVCCTLLVCWGEAKATPTKFVATGTLSSLPHSKPCIGRTVRVTTRYRLEQLGPKAPPSLRPGRLILVVHECPRHNRGYAKHAKGDAPYMKVADRHRLTLRALPAPPKPRGSVEVIDPFDASETRYRALETLLAPYPARMVVSARGAGTNHQLTFDQPQVNVGSDAAADLRLADGKIAPTHLRLVTRGDKVVVHPVAGQTTLLDGKPLVRPTPITYRNKLGLGPYTVEVSLLTDPWYDRR